MAFNHTEKLKKDFQEAFPQITACQLWFLVKFAKHVRLRARNNAAFNNAANYIFAPATFRQVNKTRADGSTYPGLEITLNNEVSSDNGEDES